MSIALIVEGATEKAFVPFLRTFLKKRLSDRPMPKLNLLVYGGRIPTEDKLKRTVENLLRTNEIVIALTDVYTGQTPPPFVDAASAKEMMRQWVGVNDRFFPHAAQYDFEAWLIPYWEDIKKLAKSDRSVPGNLPEQINHNNPPSKRIKEAFLTGASRRAYIKPRDAGRILRDNDLSISAQRCPELKAFLNTILSHCGAEAIP